MKVQQKLDEIKALVSAARTLPMSSSIVINKAELLRLLTELDELLPDDLAQAEAVLSRRDAMLYEATANAERLLTATIEERQRMISEEEVLRAARIEADEVIQDAQERSERTFREIDEYVDAKLAHLEVSVTTILEAVRQGRQRLAEPGLYGELASLNGDNEAAEPASLPQRPMSVAEGPLLAAGRSAGSASRWDEPPRWATAPGEEAATSGVEATTDSEVPPQRADRRVGTAEPAGSDDTREISGPAESSVGWTPRRHENVDTAEADDAATGGSEPVAQSAEDASEDLKPSTDAAPDAARSRQSADDAERPGAEQEEPAPDAQPQEARTD